LFGGVVFDKIISAFKINNRRIELSRTTHDKTHSDFIKCTLLPINTEMCFIDNSLFCGMKHERVYYIQPQSYHHHLSTSQIIDRVKGFPNSSELTPFLYYFFNSVGRITHGAPTFKKLENDIYVAKKIMYHVKEFFLLSNLHSHTKKTNVRIGRFTRKKIYY